MTWCLKPMYCWCRSGLFNGMILWCFSLWVYYGGKMILFSVHGKHELGALSIGQIPKQYSSWVTYVSTNYIVQNLCFKWLCLYVLNYLPHTFFISCMLYILWCSLQIICPSLMGRISVLVVLTIPECYIFLWCRFWSISSWFFSTLRFYSAHQLESGEPFIFWRHMFLLLDSCYLFYSIVGAILRLRFSIIML